MKGGEYVNIGSLQALIGSTNNQETAPMKNDDGGSSSFGSVFASLNRSRTTITENVEQGIPSSLAIELLNADTLKHLEDAMKMINSNETIEISDQLDGLLSLGQIGELTDLLALDSEKVVERLQELLEGAGIPKEEVDNLSPQSDVWQLINLIDKAGPAIFQNLLGMKETMSAEIPANKTIDLQLSAFLKTIDIVVPKTDMTITMEQKLFSFQSLLSNIGEQLEQSIRSANAKRVELPFMRNEQNARNIIETVTNQLSKKNSDGSQTGAFKSNTSPENVQQTTVQTVVNKVEPVFNQQEIRQASRSENLMQELQTLFKRSNFGQVGSSNRMLIKLYPEHLGQIRIELHETNGIMTARILSTTALAKEMLESQLHHLRQAFHQQNLQVERIDITQSIQDPSRNEREQAFNEQYKREQQQQQNDKNKPTEEEMSFDEYLIELEV